MKSKEKDKVSFCACRRIRREKGGKRLNWLVFFLFLFKIFKLLANVIAEVYFQIELRGIQFENKSFEVSKKRELRQQLFPQAISKVKSRAKNRCLHGSVHFSDHRHMFSGPQACLEHHFGICSGWLSLKRL